MKQLTIKKMKDCWGSESWFGLTPEGYTTEAYDTVEDLIEANPKFQGATLEVGNIRQTLEDFENQLKTSYLRYHNYYEVLIDGTLNKEEVLREMIYHEDRPGRTIDYSRMNEGYEFRLNDDYLIVKIAAIDHQWRFVTLTKGGDVNEAI